MPGLLDQFSSLSQPTEDDLKKARTMGLLAAGLGILGHSGGQGYRPSLGQAVGQGAMPGLLQYNSVINEAPQARLRNALAGMQVLKGNREIESMKTRDAFFKTLPENQRGLAEAFPDQMGARLAAQAVPTTAQAPWEAGGMTPDQFRTYKKEPAAPYEAGGMDPAQYRGYLADKASRSATRVQVENYPAPVPVLGPDGKPTLVQFGNRGDIRPTGLRPPKTAAELKEEENQQKTLQRAHESTDTANLVMRKVDDALRDVGFMTAGPVGALLGNVPGTKAYDLDKTIDTIKANVGFKELAEMRANSPTGGALGQIAVRELDFLQAAIASLDKGQSPDRLRQNLGEIKSSFERWKGAVRQSAGLETESTMDEMPPAPKHKGRIIEDDHGNRYRSDGMRWKKL